jgi:CheY-like chemotaxis protein
MNPTQGPSSGKGAGETSHSAGRPSEATSSPEPATAHPRAPAPEIGVTRRILLAEDSEDIQRLISAYLEPTAHHLEIASDGQAAVAKFISGHFDVVLMDAQMPVMDGHTAARRIRDWEAQQAVRPAIILALSGGAADDEPGPGRKPRYDAHLSKPIQKAVLLQAIDEHLKARDAIRVLAPQGIEHLIPGYLDNRGADLHNLAAAIERSDYDTIRVLGHNMKGSGNAYGFAAISAIGRSLERAAQEQSSDDIRTQISVLVDYLKRVEIVC